MEGVSLQFQGLRDPWLLVSILVVIAAVLLTWGAWQLLRGRWRYGLICVASAFTAVGATVALVVDAAMRYSSGNRRGANASLLAAGALAALTAGGAAMFIGSNYSDGALWMTLLGLEVAIAVGVFYTAVYSYLGTQRLSTLMALRFAAILALLLILFKPAIRVSAGPGGNLPYLPILVDRSGSMSVADDPHIPDRYSQAGQMLNSQLSRLKRNFRPVWHHFAASLETAESLDALSRRRPSGEGTDSTNIAKAVRGAAGEYRRSDLAGILLLTDGIDNGGDVVGDAVIEAGVPIYAIGIGAATEASAGRVNLQIVSADAPMEAVVNNATTVTVRVRAARLGNAVAEVQLFEEGGDQPAAREAVRTDKSVDTVTVPLRWTPKGAAQSPDATSKPAGPNIRKVRIVIPKNPAETVTEDNETELHVMLTEPRIRVLYIEGSMRPEYKYLKRLLDTDTNVRYTGLVRISENKFWAYGTSDGKQLTALPAGDEEFAQFDVIILGDLDRTFLSPQQLAQVRKFVDNGGGLLMMGGHNSFGPGGYGGTDIETVLPVLMGTRAQPQETTPFIPQLTADGESHPVFEGIAGFFPGPGGRMPKQGDPKLPDLLGCVTVQQAKTGASVLALHPTRRNDKGLLTVLAAQSFGKGRSAAFTADTTWQWFMSMQSLGADSPYQRFWAQLIRWLANVQIKSRESAPAAMLRMDRSYAQVGEKIKFLARVQDAKGRASESAQASCTVVPAEGTAKVETIPLAPAMGKGLFEVEYRPQRPGRYTVKLTSLDATGQSLGADELPLYVAAHSTEMEHLARNDGLLQIVARDSDGRYADISALPDLIDYIVERQKGRTAPQPQGTTYYLYHFPLLFLLFVGLLTGEWMLRRSWQLH